MPANKGSEPEGAGGRAWSSGSPRVSAPFLQELIPGWLPGCWVRSASVLGGASGVGQGRDGPGGVWGQEPSSSSQTACPARDQQDQMEFGTKFPCFACCERPGVLKMGCRWRRVQDPHYT